MLEGLVVGVALAAAIGLAIWRRRVQSVLSEIADLLREILNLLRRDR